MIKPRAGIKHIIDGKECVLVPLSRGKFAIVDLVDADSILKYNWYAQPANNTAYAVRRIHNPETWGGTYICMHRLIVPGGDVVDHINRNGLDNRRQNLRPCKHFQNCANGPAKNQLRGVRKTRSGTYQSYMVKHGKFFGLGTFKTATEAALARDVAALDYYGEFAVLNYSVKAKLEKQKEVTP